MYGDPIVHFLTLWQFDHLPEIDTWLKTGLSLFMQWISYGSLCEAFLWSECLSKAGKKWLNKFMNYRGLDDR